MKATASQLIFSATDLSNFLACPHLTLLDRAVQVDGIARAPTYDHPGLAVFQQRGEEHERAYLERLKGAGKRVVELAMPGSAGLSYEERWERYAAASLEAMRGGADVVFQAGLYDGTWLGKADFLVRVEEPSELGEWSYEVVDTKLAREAKGGALLQVLLYADLLATLQGRRPRRVHLALGGPDAREESFRVAAYDAYFRSVRDRFLRHVDDAGGPGDGASAALPVAPDPVAHCDICDWRVRCDRERREVDHLSLVAGIHRSHRDALRGRGIDTLESLATLELPLEPRLEGVGTASLERVREQARIQLEGRRRGERIHELLGPPASPVVAGEGLAGLPSPSPGDLFFDIEGDRFALTHGLEYLLGWTDSDGEYASIRALDRAAEKAAFERFIDTVMERWARWPDMHVYHYAPYEPSAMKRLMGLHGTREEEVDRLLRGGVFVDLYRVVRQGLRASVEKYSIKDLEPLYGFEREVDLREAGAARANFEALLELGQADAGEAGESADAADPMSLLDVVEAYNRDDCVSTLRLRDWLETQREELARITGEPVPRPERPDADPADSVAEEDEEVARLVAELTKDVPADEEARTPEQHARWLLAQTLGFHRREDKSTWWEYFRCLELSDDERVEDRATLGGLEYEGVVDEVKRSHVHRYRFPRQEHGIDEKSQPRDPATESSAGTVVRVDDSEGVIELKRGKSSDVPHPRALVPLDHVNNTVQRESLRRLARAVCDDGLGEDSARRAAVDLLLRRPPRCGQEDGVPLIGTEGSPGGPGEDSLEAACRLVRRLDGSLLAIQGPPGSGKTYTGARMILRLIEDGKRVGVTATSHKVISNLLDAVCKAADEEGVELRGVQKPSGSGRSACADDRIEKVTSNEAVFAALEVGTASVAAGTAWLWSREEAAGSVDVLFIDEAGQFSLANALAVSQAGASLVLLGDPAQLQQPQQGSHPPGSEASALEHFLAGEVTMPPDRGLFLAKTWRLHPEICRFTSEIYYGERLEPRPDLARQTLSGDNELAGAGLRYVPVSHAGNANESAEEAEAVAALVDRLLADGRTWTDRHGRDHELKLPDILVVAPYNAQVSAIARRLPEAARVGTVDKFQGQEAPVVIYSTASSTADDAPRGMAFLYDPHRLNVATSRARCLAVVVGSPALFTPDCRSPEQMRYANGFCRFRELAGEVEVEQVGIYDHPT